MTEARTWGSFKNLEEANKSSFVLPPEDQGYTLRIDDLTDPTPSPFENRNKQGELLPPAWQTSVTFTIVDYINDDENESVIGQTIRQFFTISLNTKANFYRLVKAAFGGEIDPQWTPVAADLEGKLIGASLVHKEPNEKGQVFPKIDAMAPYRGKKKDFSHIPVAGPAVPKTDTSDVPF